MAHSRSQSRKGVQAGGEGAEGAHVGRGAAAVGRGGDELLGDDVNAGGVRVVGDVQRGVGGGELFAPVVFALALAHDVWFALVRMMGQPPNTMSQSPERGRQGSLRSRAATNGRLAGAAAMLTHGVAIVSRHHWQSGLLPRHAHRDFTTPPAPANHSCASPASPCYSLAVKSSAACSGANHEHRSETRAKPPRRKEKTI